MKLLKKDKAGDIKVIFGGTVAPDDFSKLRKAGIAEVFGPGSSLKKIIESVTRIAAGPAD